MIFFWDKNDVDNETIDTSLSLVASQSLTNLKIRCNQNELTENTIKQLAINCPELKQFHLESVSTPKIVNTIVKHFVNLESLKFLMTGRQINSYVFEEGLTNDKLKSLCTDGSSKIKSLGFSKLIGC